MAETILSKRPTKKQKIDPEIGVGLSWKTLKNQKQLMLMSFPIVIYILIFNYVPIWGWLMAFQNYRPALKFSKQQWVGLKQFKFLFQDDTFLTVLRNTLAMSMINLVLSFATAIILALLLNEIKVRFWKRSIQTISYLPHFLSWIIAAGIVSTSLSVDDGIINQLLMKLHLINEPVMWLSQGKYFWGIVGLSNVWKEVGWNTIIYLAAITSIDPSLYESAGIDGANRYQKILYVTLPGIKSTFIILLIMNIGHILDAGFEIQYLLGNGLVVDWSQTIDIFVLKYGIAQGNYSLATAAGIFKTVVSIILILIANSTAKRLGEERLI
ncbi:putative aldouronate transport system permease protein [Paenibacillus sp. V4I3]|uniref:ABC transporter permease n=1 Tax=Paenibacillus TaxID=44249 RepID=UPI0003FD760D|nr:MULTISPECIES: ABC transporter permease subunit [Paenibacillus]MCY9663473.1 ABC transporter permease subunit [Paenibacillus alginolyticus]MDQ0877779.1 putative aldouronate transport system permease protein [Paenibacillus sp. V4I3]MDQ0886348.1 putative aldouronate transport system permease protein [Paenibacillus sp. V4I9]